MEDKQIMVSSPSYRCDPDQMFFETVVKAIPYLFLGDEPDLREKIVRDLRNTFHRLQHYPSDDEVLLSLIKEIDINLEENPANGLGYIQKGEINAFRTFFEKHLTKRKSGNDRVLDAITRNPDGITQEDAICEIVGINSDVLKRSRAERSKGKITQTSSKIKSVESSFSNLKIAGLITNTKGNRWILK